MGFFPHIYIIVQGGCSSAVESQIVDLVVAGSNPVIHPDLLYLGKSGVEGFDAPVAHLDRVTDFESVGSPFESGRAQT